VGRGINGTSSRLKIGFGGLQELVIKIKTPNVKKNIFWETMPIEF